MLRVAGAVARPCKQTDMSLAEFWHELERSKSGVSVSARVQLGRAVVRYRSCKQGNMQQALHPSLFSAPGFLPSSLSTCVQGRDRIMYIQTFSFVVWAYALCLSGEVAFRSSATFQPDASGRIESDRSCTMADLQIRSPECPIVLAVTWPRPLHRFKTHPACVTLPASSMQNHRLGFVFIRVGILFVRCSFFSSFLSVSSVRSGLVCLESSKVSNGICAQKCCKVEDCRRVSCAAHQIVLFAAAPCVQACTQTPGVGRHA